MGITCWTTCQECDEEAPEMGDCGYLGYPSLEESVPGVDVATFGSIYAGLAAVHLVTDEVDAFRRFLERHRGHRVVTDSEGGSPFGEDEEDLYDEGDESYEEDDELEDELDELEDLDDLEDEDEDEIAEGTYSQARYRARCAKCNQSIDTKTAYFFVPFEPATLTKDDVQAFRKKVVAVLEEASYRAEPFHDDDTATLSKFFGKHGEHGLTVELVE